MKFLNHIELFRIFLHGDDKGFILSEERAKILPKGVMGYDYFHLIVKWESNQMILLKWLNPTTGKVVT